MSETGPVPPAVGESATTRWRRRAVSIPTMLVLSAVAIVTAPVVAACLAIADAAVGRPRLPRVRVHAVLVQYLFNDATEIVLAPLYWVLAGFGTRLDSAASRRRHARLQRWSLNVLAHRADRLLGLRMEIESCDQLGPGPVIVLARHVSLADASLPALVYGADTGIDLRGVIMAELLSDPGFDLLYGRLGSIFIDRDRSDDAIAAIRELGTGLDDDSAAVIFPEGRLFRPDVRDRAIERLHGSDPARAARLAHLRNVLPPRPGGVLALLDGAPDADVVVIAHVGFESVPSVGALARSAPVSHTIVASVRRIERTEIPTDAAGHATWLDGEWLRMDTWITQRAAATDDPRQPELAASGMRPDHQRVPER